MGSKAIYVYEYICTKKEMKQTVRHIVRLKLSNNKPQRISKNELLNQKPYSTHLVLFKIQIE